MARRPPMCSASWLTCSTRPDQLVDLYRIWSVPRTGLRPVDTVVFPDDMLSRKYVPIVIVRKYSTRVTYGTLMW